jgi:hypothetical protein
VNGVFAVTQLLDYLARTGLYQLTEAEFRTALGATAHDEAHDAFMTLPPYTRTSEASAGEWPQTCRLGL